MTTGFVAVRRTLVGREVGIALAVLVAGSVLVSGFVPGYLAVLLASGVRNVYAPWLGSGIPFYAVAFAFLYAEAVAVAVLFRGLRDGYRKVGRAIGREPEVE